ncbi:hypothetical protein PINS_up010269 [Pythium insidiosum]|nr:hypothetical protein PINS_up010269 [Pythium insidiosum]
MKHWKGQQRASELCASRSRHTSRQRQADSPTPRVCWTGALARQLRLFARVAIVRSPMLVCVLMSSIYIQVVAEHTLKSTQAMYVLMACSFILKVIIQELAKHAVVHRKSTIKNARTMFLMVALPTILIDTQLRIALQRGSSASITIRGTVLMAMTEISWRVIKSLHIRLQLRHQDRRVHSRNKPTASSSALNLIRSKLLAYYAAELYADMLAEYVAMGCSTAVLVFFWNHPKFQLGDFQDSTGARAWSSHQTIVLVCQALTEILVDLLSCTIEIYNGIYFHAIKQQSAYLALLSVVIAICNINTTAAFYILTET